MARPRKALPWTMLLFALFLSGCTGSIPRAEEGANAAPITRSSPDRTPPGILATAPNTDYAWATSESLGDRALWFSFEMGKGNECRLNAVLAGRETQPGVLAVQHLDVTGTDFRFSVLGDGDGTAHTLWTRAASVYEGGDPLGRFGHYALSFTAEGSYDGVLNVTLLGLGLESWSNKIGPASAALTILCAEPVTLLGARSSQELRIFDGRSLKAGLAANAYGYGAGAHVGVRDTIQLTTAASQSYLQLNVRDGVVGRFQITTPTESATLDALGTRVNRMMQSGPGTLRVDVDAAALYPSFVGSLYGLDQGLPPVRLLEGPSA